MLKFNCSSLYKLPFEPPHLRFAWPNPLHPTCSPACLPHLPRIYSPRCLSNTNSLTRRWRSPPSTPSTPPNKIFLSTSHFISTRSLAPLILTPPFGYLLTSLPPERKSPSLLIDRLHTTTTSIQIQIGPRVVACSKIRATPTPHRVLKPHHVWLHPKLFTQLRLSVILLLHSSPLSAHPNPLVRPPSSYLQPTRANAIRGESQ